MEGSIVYGGHQMIHTAIDYLKSIGEPQQRAEDQRNLGENLLRKIKEHFSSENEIWLSAIESFDLSRIYFTQLAHSPR